MAHAALTLSSGRTSDRAIFTVPRFFLALLAATFIALGIVVFLFVLACFMALPFSPALVEQRLASIRASGQPTTLDELDAWYEPVREEMNGAEVYRDAYRLFIDLSELDASVADLNDIRIPPDSTPLPPESQNVIEKYIEANTETLELLEEGVRWPECRYPVNLKKGWDSDTSHLDELDTLVWFLYCAIAAYTDGGEIDRAVQGVVDMLALSRSLRNEPELRAQLTGAGFSAWSVDAINRMVNRVVLSDQQLATLDGVLALTDVPMSMRRAFVGERCMDLAEMWPMENRLKHTDDSVSHRVRFSATERCFFRGLCALDTFAWLDASTTIIEASKGSFPDSLDIAKEVHERCSAWHSRWLYATRENTSTMTRCLSFFADREAHVRLGHVLLAIERYRLVTDALPESIDVLVPDYLAGIPVDPFDGFPLRYVKTTCGYLIYSIGRDRDDDGGIEDEETAWKGDIVLDVERRMD